MSNQQLPEKKVFAYAPIPVSVAKAPTKRKKQFLANLTVATEFTIITTTPIILATVATTVVLATAVETVAEVLLVVEKAMEVVLGATGSQ